MNEWQAPPSPIPPTDAAEVHLWRASLKGALPDGADAILSKSERERADRFRTAKLRQRFVHAHLTLRSILAQYTGVSPEALTFGAADRGKPHLITNDSIQFNLSHSGNRALVAIASVPVGVDVETHRADTDWQAIAKRFFNPSEQEEIASVSASQQREAFYRCWTRKESFVKAVGGGIASGLESFNAGVFDDQPATVGSSVDAEPYTILSLPEDTGWSAAVALRGNTIRTRLFSWDSTL